MSGGLVANLEVLDLGVPHGGVLHLLHRKAEEPPGDLEEAGLDFFQGEPGAQHLVVDVEALPAELLHQPGNVPGLQRAEAGVLRALFQFGCVAPVEGVGVADQLVEEGPYPLARACHEHLETVVREVGIAEDVGETAADLQDPGDDGCVVPVARRTAVEEGGVDLMAQRLVVGVLQHCLHTGHVEREQPPFLALVRGQLCRALHRRPGEPRQSFGVADHLLEGGRLVQDVLLEATTEFGEFDAQPLQ